MLHTFFQKMKITVKNSQSSLSSRINNEQFNQKAKSVFKSVVQKQIKNAEKSKSLNLGSTQKAHTNCNSPI